MEYFKEIYKQNSKWYKVYEIHNAKLVKGNRIASPRDLRDYYKVLENNLDKIVELKETYYIADVLMLIGEVARRGKYLELTVNKRLKWLKSQNKNEEAKFLEDSYKEYLTMQKQDKRK